VPEIKLAEIAMQVLLPDVMVHPVDPAFQCRKISLNRICGDAHARLASSKQPSAFALQLNN
jgi:hypothetical protein